MEKLQVKITSFPKRCEICHQTDLFDPVKNFCERCDTNSSIKKLKIENLALTHPQVPELRELMPVTRFVATLGTIVISLLIIESFSRITVIAYPEKYTNLLTEF